MAVWLEGLIAMLLWHFLWASENVNCSHQRRWENVIPRVPSPWRCHWIPCPGGLVLNPEVAFQFPLQLPLPTPQASYNYPHNKEGLGRAASSGGTRAGHWLLRWPNQAGRNEACPPLSVALALMDFFSRPPDITRPLFAPRGQSDRCVHPPQSPAPIPPHPG